MNRHLLAAVVLLLPFASGCGSLPKAPSTQSLLDDDYSLVIEYLERYVPVQMKKHDFVGLSVALVDDQRVVWSEGFGLADKSAGTLATASTMYRAGSVSKLFTAMAAMKLAEEGKVDLDAPLTSRVPELDLKTRFGSLDGVTLRNVLSHHAGIPSAIVDGMWAERPESFRTVATRLGRYHAAYPPDTVFAYSNAGYSLAGHAVENVSGVPFVDYVTDALLTPLGMSDSNIAFDTSNERVAGSYVDGQEVQELGLRDLPAGGLVTTVGDMSNLVKLINADGLLGSRLFEPRTVAEMLAVQEHDSPYEPDGYNGIGWFNFFGYLDGKYTAVGHSGQTLAHSASVLIVPELGLGVVLLANSPSLENGLEQITEGILRVAHTVKTREPLSSIPSPDRPAKPLPGIDTGFDGRYTSDFGTLTIGRDGDGYAVEVDGETLRLEGNSEDGHSLTARLLGFIPVKPPGLGELSFFAREVSGEKILYMARPGDLTAVVATEIETRARDAAWDARLGDYELVNPPETDSVFYRIDGVSLTYGDGFYQLAVDAPLRSRTLPLDIVDESEATLQGYGRGRGETVFVQPDGSLLHAGWVFAKK